MRITYKDIKDAYMAKGGLAAVVGIETKLGGSMSDQSLHRAINDLLSDEIECHDLVQWAMENRRYGRAPGPRPLEAGKTKRYNVLDNGERGIFWRTPAGALGLGPGDAVDVTVVKDAKVPGGLKAIAVPVPGGKQ